MNIRNYTPADQEELFKLSIQFETSPYTFDNRVYEELGSLEPVFAREMLNRAGTFTFVLEDNDTVIGYVSITKNSVISQVIGWEVGSLLLLVIDKEYRGRGLGKYLVEKALRSIEGQGIEILTVGTDIYNLPAINSYERNGFVSRLCWHIYRYYPEKTGVSRELDEKVEVLSKADLNLYKDSFQRPVSLLNEPGIPGEKLRDYLWETMKKKCGENPYPVLELKLDNHRRAMAQIQLDRLSMQSLGCQGNIYRVSDLIVIDQEDPMSIGTRLLDDLKNRFNDAEYLEMWLRADDKRNIHLLEANGFQLNYTGLSLHKRFRS